MNTIKHKTNYILIVTILIIYHFSIGNRIDKVFHLQFRLMLFEGSLINIYLHYIYSFAKNKQSIIHRHAY